MVYLAVLPMPWLSRKMHIIHRDLSNFEGMVVKVNLALQGVTNVTACLVAPNTVKFNSKQEFFVVDRGKGEIVMINLTASDTDANRKVIAQFRANSIDNLAFDKVDRLFFLSTTDASLTEVFPNGELRIVCCGDISIPMILAAIKTHIRYTQSIQELYVKTI